MTPDEMYMNRALELAKMADSSVFPNPFVGAVIVYCNEIIAEGYHQKYGGPHAEVLAVNQVQDKSILSQSTIYVTLEPCAHHGKTPPCADLLVRHQFKRVVIGSVDPFALVNGAGISKLKNAGIEVEVDVLKEPCDELNKRFFTFHQKKRPWIALKWAESQDGFIAPKLQEFGQRIKITGDLSHQIVHLQRSKEHAILIGTQTALVDDPKLDVRLVKGVNPLRIVIDAELKLPPTLQLFSDSLPTWVLNLLKNSSEGAVNFMKLEQLDPQTICNQLYELGILSVYIEGGANTIQRFIDLGFWDTIYQFIGETNLGEGVSAPTFGENKNAKLSESLAYDQDKLLIYENAF